MARKPYKFNIEYVQKFYSYGSEAVAVDQRPIYRKDPAPKVPKPKRQPVKIVSIDPVAFCSLMLAIVMTVLLVSSVIRYNVVREDYDIMHSYLMTVMEENIIKTQQYTAGYDLEEVRETAIALGMVPVESVETITVSVTIPEPEPERTWWDDVVWFFSGLIE